MQCCALVGISGHFVVLAVAIQTSLVSDALQQVNLVKFSLPSRNGPLVLSENMMRFQTTGEHAHDTANVTGKERPLSIEDAKPY
eukprot:1902583-Amphidinium_carterae.1